ncbi:PmoA family protein [Prosthecobacter fusiformis]|nr:PmoA family protein [Prosthecobacter fusiformis]
MKPILLLLLALASAPLLAAPGSITVHGGDADQTNAIVTFTAPQDWQGQHTLSGKGGSIVSTLQVDATGQAVMIVPQIGKGENITFAITPSSPPAAPQGLTVEKSGSLLRFTHHTHGKTQPVFDYQMEPGDVPAGVPEVFKHGAHLHPVYTPGGRLITGNHPADHRWHRGIWFAWTKTEFEGQHPDFWNQGKSDSKDKIAAQILGEVRFDSLLKSWGGPVQAGFLSKHRFLDHNSGTTKPVLDETWEVTAYALTTGDRPAYILDLVSTQTCATDSPLKLPEYHYGGLGVRGHEQWNPVDKVTMLTSNGDDRKKGDSTKAQWVQMGGDVDGQPAGMAILIHPENFRFPQPLRLNPKNPQLCIAPSQGGDWTIQPGQPYTSKYRFILTDGPADAKAIDTAWQAYAHPLKVTVE